MSAEHYAGVTTLDYSNESSSHNFGIGAITELSLAGFLSQFGDYKNALANIILGTIQKDIWVGDRTVLNNSAPASPQAQNELGFRVFYHGAVNQKKGHMTIGTADPSKVVPGTDQVDMTDTDIAAFVTAFETIAKMPDDDTEGVEVDFITLVGRNV